MRPRTPPRAILTVSTVLATILATFGLVAAGPAPARAADLPAHVFAPYFESWTGADPAALAQQSGNTYLTMAFLQTAASGSCTAYWNGDTGSPISSSTFGSSISSIQSGGGDVIPSFGGYSADHGGTEIADSCTSVDQIAAVYEKVITTYGVTRIDLDVEDNSLTNSAGIDRRNKAIEQVESWAASTGHTVRFSYTLPTTTSGLADSGMAVLRNAVSNGARIDVVNLMTFDYYDGASHEMAQDTESAATGLHGQLAGLYPGKSSADLWSMIGVTEMIGIDDYGPAETFTTGDAATVENWAASTGINTLSFWALQRDNGGCPGTKGSGSCSGVSQSTWFFSNAFEPFNSGSGGTGGGGGGGGGTGGGSSLANADFETGSLSPWNCQSGGAVVGSPVHSGGHALQVAPTSSQTGQCGQAVTLQPNHSYTLTAWVQGSYAYVGVSGDASASTWASSGGWTKLTVPFTTGSTGQVTVYVHGWYAQGDVYADDFALS